jgi:hypothetical protein
MIMNSINWRLWHWPWHSKRYDEHYKIYAHFAGFGPFQFHWWSKR